MVQIVTMEEFQDFSQKVFEKLELIQNQQQGQGDGRWLKSNDVKRMLNISHGKLQQMRDRREINFTKVGGVIFYDREDINRILSKGIVKK